MVRDTIDFTRNMLTSRHVGLRTQLAPTLPLIAGDRVQLQQLILNLIVNATDAMDHLAEEGRVLTISTSLRWRRAFAWPTDGRRRRHWAGRPFWSTRPRHGQGPAICRPSPAHRQPRHQRA
jgi:nitrogen-specific signal transduction histidine kinase